MIRQASKTIGFSEPTTKEKKLLHLEKRKRARVSIRVPVSCVSVDLKDKPLGRYKGIVRNVSQTGLKIEAENDVSSDRLKLRFVDFNKSTAEITGKVAFSQRTPSGTYKIGVQLQGNRLDIIQFVSRLVRFHHYTKKCVD